MTSVALLGPVTAPAGDLPADVLADLARLAGVAGPAVELSYRFLDEGPVSIRTEADVARAAPAVVRAVVALAESGVDAVVVDCTDDPGVTAARDAVDIPVVGTGEALRAAAAGAEPPVVHVTGDELRALSVDELVARVQSAGARTVALGGSGWSHVAEILREATGATVLDPLDVAVAAVLGGR